MFIKKTTKRVKGKTYFNYLLVNSVATPKGSRHKVICSLGNLAPAPEEEWLALARKVEAALLGQMPLLEDPRVDDIVDRVQARRRQKPAAGTGAVDTVDRDVVSVHTDQVEVEDARQAGPQHVGHQMWLRLGVDQVLARAGLSPKTRLLTEVMTLNRLVHPSSEHAMPDWVRRTALSDILGADLKTLNDEALYRNLDRLHPQRAAIEEGLAEHARTLFNAGNSVFLYDLTSTYFEGQCPRNPQAKRGHSRDKRPDCKQVTVGLVLDCDGFPKAHEVFDGSRQDRTTVSEMLASLEKRVGRVRGATVVVDRGMAFEENLEQIRERGYHYIVASRQSERQAHLADFEDDDDWQEVARESSPRNPAQKKPSVYVKQRTVADEVHVLCRSEGRASKDRAIREKHEARLLADLEKLRKRIAARRLVKEEKIHQAIGRLRERHSRVARYYDIVYDTNTRSLSWTEDSEKKARAKRLDGGYLLKTDRRDLPPDEIWRTYILLTRVEEAFRSMKSPLMERPIWHHLEHRVQTHIFLCVLAYHLLVAIEKMFLDSGIHTSWATLREQLSTHQVVTVALPATNGKTLRIRKSTTPEPPHREIYRTLQITQQVMTPVRTWSPSIVTEKAN
jgi:transposase